MNPKLKSLIIDIAVQFIQKEFAPAEAIGVIDENEPAKLDGKILSGPWWEWYVVVMTKENAYGVWVFLTPNGEFEPQLGTKHASLNQQRQDVQGQTQPTKRDAPRWYAESGGDQAQE